jgi:hypothetical protein
VSRFRVLASAQSVLIGELILISLNEHISDLARLEVLEQTAAQFKNLRVPVNEEVELYIIDPTRQAANNNLHCVPTRVCDDLGGRLAPSEQ